MSAATNPAAGAARALDVERVRREFPILRERVHGKPLVYLDNAASAQKPRAVIEAEAAVYERYYSNIHRGVHSLSMRATDASSRTGRWITGPSPLANSSPTPSGSTINRISAKRIAASTPSRAIGCSVTSAAASGLRASSRNPKRSRMARYSGR